MGSAGIMDIAPDGRALLEHEVVRAGLVASVAGEERERDLSWLDFSRPSDLSLDGKTVLFTESGAGAGPTPVVFVRRTDGSPAVRLANGSGVALSPDAQWVATRSVDGKTLTVMPIGPGRARALDTGGLTVLPFGAWLPDGTGLVVSAFEPGRPRRAFLQPLD